MKRLPIIALILLGSFALRAQEQTATDSLKILSNKILTMLESSTVSAQLFFAYRYTDYSTADSKNEFAIKRGYINFTHAINENLSGRITPDITIDKEGDGEGDVEMRLKYCYMEYKHKGGKFFSNPKIVVGEVYTPFIEFEEKINRYRVEGSHYLDRIKQISSADFGLTLSSELGGKIDSDYQKRVSKNHAGRFGSVAIGIYNGGGYHALEKNQNKTFQWRLSLRPLPEYIPGLQFSYTGAEGRGNTADEPYWNLHAGMCSYESEYFVVTGQAFTAKGNFEGEVVDALNSKALNNSGYSLFTEVKFLKKKFSFFGRYDEHTIEAVAGNIEAKRYIAGLAYHIVGKSKVVVDYDYWESTSAADKNVGVYEIAVELAF